MWKSGGNVHTRILMCRKCFHRLVLFFFAILALCIIISLEFSSTEIENEKNEIIMNVKHSQLNTPKVRFVVAQTMFAPGWCRMLASAILSNISVATVGFGKKYTHTRRISWIMRYIEEEELRDYDIIISFDGADTLFTGALAVQKAIDKFINTTASSSDSFNAMDVISGKATAPFLFTAETTCYHPQITHVLDNASFSRDICLELYEEAWKFMKYNLSSLNSAEPGNSMFQFLNAGGYIARVWAFKKAVAAFRILTSFKRQKFLRWKCDQSAWGLLYLWSLTRHVRVSPEMHIPLTVLLPKGLINLDFHNLYFITSYGTLWGRDFAPMSSKTIAEVIASDKLPFPLFFHIINSPNSTPAILHFNSRGMGTTQGTIDNLINHTSWFIETRRSSESLIKTNTFLENDAHVEFHISRGRKKKKRFGVMCPAAQVPSRN